MAQVHLLSLLAPQAGKNGFLVVVSGIGSTAGNRLGCLCI